MNAKEIEACLELSMEFDPGEKCEIVCYGSKRDMKRLETRIIFWKELETENESLKSQLFEAQQALLKEGMRADALQARINGGIRVNSGRDTIFRIYAVGRDLVSPEDEDIVKCKTNATMILDEGVEL